MEPSLARFATRRPLVVVVLVAASALGIVTAGCGDSEPAKTSTRSTASPVPASLGHAESSAEDIVDFARAGNRAKVVAAARELQRTAEGPVAADLRKADVPADIISSFQVRARLVDSIADREPFLRVSLAANQVSGVMPDLYARYSDPVPPGVLQLDYLDREAQLRSLAEDQASVRDAVLKLSSTWAKLRPQVIEAGAKEAAADFTRHVGAMRRHAAGSNARALQKEASTGLELVDDLEGVFRRQ
jgi:hypothetical protein